MARITVEDCVGKVEDRFELVIVASERAKELQNGTPALVERDNDKNTVIALREISEDKIDVDMVRSNVVLSFRHNIPFAEIGEKSSDLEFIEKEIMSDMVFDKDSASDLSTVSEEELKSVL